MELFDLETETDFRQNMWEDHLLGLWGQRERRTAIEAYMAGHPGALDGCDAEKAALGGVPGGLGVMVNGVYLTFPDKKPHARNGAVYVPAEALSVVLGREPQTVTANGYAPLRASAEAAGYTVCWDPDFETAVLLGPADLAGELDALLDLLSKGDFQIRADYDTGVLYLTASSFPSLFSILGKTYSKNVWLSWERAAAAPGGADTVGASLAVFSLAMAELNGTAPVYYYQTAYEYGRMCVSLLGDANFEKKGDDQVLSLDSEALTVTADGAVTGSFAFRPQSAYSALADLRVRGDWTLDGEHEDAAIEYHLKNFCKVLVTIESETRPTGLRPETTPPETAVVAPMDETPG